MLKTMFVSDPVEFWTAVAGIVLVGAGLWCLLLEMRDEKKRAARHSLAKQEDKAARLLLDKLKKKGVIDVKEPKNSNGKFSQIGKPVKGMKPQGPQTGGGKPPK